MQKCFECVYRVLNRDGVFIFDLNTRKGLMRWNGITILEDEEGTIITRGVYSQGMERAYTKISGFHTCGGSKYERFDEMIYNTVFCIQEVKQLLNKIGFQKIICSGPKSIGEDEKDPEKLDRVFFQAYQ